MPDYDLAFKWGIWSELVNVLTSLSDGQLDIESLCRFVRRFSVPGAEQDLMTMASR